MDPQLAQRVQAAIATATGQTAQIAREEMATGGSVGNARRLRLKDGRGFFLKSIRPGEMPGLFAAEAAGLEALGAANILPVPQVIAVEEDFLLLEQIEIAGPEADYFENFGRNLARLHREARQEKNGFEDDNYLGRARQPNTWNASWTQFFAEKRLGYQLGILKEQGDQEVLKLGERLLARLSEWLGDVTEKPSLLHGDLWAGNVICAKGSRAVLIDPAVYYGHREAELAMPRLFGGFAPAFFAAYQEEWPLPPGHEERGAIYELYHLLNHYNLFGAAYRGPCLEILRRLVG